MTSRRTGVTVSAVIVLAAIATRSAAGERDGWVFDPQTRNYEASASGSLIAFADCKPEGGVETGRPFEILAIAFSPKAIGEVVQSKMLPFVEMRSGAAARRLDVVAIVPDEILPTLWVVKAGPFYRAQIEVMASAADVSFALGGWSAGTDTVFETIKLPDAGRRDVLGRVAKECF